ncbi:Rab9 effector protein with kelch motifs-like protein [Drosera capensis]
MRWERAKVDGGGGGEGPGKRWGHTCNAIRGGRLVYVFGGYGKSNCHTDLVHVFDTVAHSWTQLATKGTPPVPRDSHTCTTVGDNLFVFGGTNGLHPLNDLHILDTVSSTWVSPSPRGHIPEAREGHSAALIGKQLFVFGGCGKSVGRSYEVYYNNLYTLNVETLVWQRVMTLGTPPAARDSHTCSAWNNKLFVIGGEDQHDYCLSDVHVLDADTLVWREMETYGQLLLPRAGHSTVTFGRFLFVFGGFSDAQNLFDDLNMLDVETGVWTKVTTNDGGPSARFSMAGDCLDPTVSGVLVFMGGCSRSLEALDDMYYLHTELRGHHVRDLGRLDNISMKRQLKMKCQEQYASAPVNDRALVAVDTNSTHFQQGQPYIYLNMYQSPTGKRTFQAKLSSNISGGYTIETYIDGKPLRGVLFSSKTSNGSMPSTLLSRKMDDMKVVEPQANGKQEANTNSVGLCKTQPEVPTPPTGMESELMSSAPNEVHDGNSEPMKKPRLSHQDGEMDQVEENGQNDQIEEKDENEEKDQNQEKGENEENYQDGEKDQDIDSSSLAPQENFSAVQGSILSPMDQDGMT